MRLAQKKAPPDISIITTYGILVKNYKIHKGWGFFFDFQLRLAQKKAPPPWGFSRGSTVTINYKRNWHWEDIGVFFNGKKIQLQVSKSGVFSGKKIEIPKGRRPFFKSMSEAK